MKKTNYLRLEKKKKKNRNATIQETLRIHPNTGTILERRAPAPHGAVIDGCRVPAGTVVGVNAWVLHRDRGVYGADADAFRPERWLEADEEARVEMSRCLFSVRLSLSVCLSAACPLVLSRLSLPPSLSLSLSLFSPHAFGT